MACSDQITSQQLEDMSYDAITAAELATSRAGGAASGALIDTSTTRLGDTFSTLRGQLAKLGYAPPIAYTSGIVFGTGDFAKTVEESGLIYAPLISALPFTTSGTFSGDDDSRFRIVSQDSLEHRVSQNETDISSNQAAIASNLSSINDIISGQVGRPDYVKLTHTLSAGTSAGNFTGNVWITRPINTKDSDSSGICTLSSNVFTLDAGEYRVAVSAPAANVNAHKLRLRNTTDSSTVMVGGAAYAPASASALTHAFINGEFTISTSKSFKIEHFCQTTALTIGLGFDNASGSENAVYCVVELWRLR